MMKQRILALALLLAFSGATLTAAAQQDSVKVHKKTVKTTKVHKKVTKDSTKTNM